MNFLFAWRYFRSKKSTNAINIIAWIAVTAIAVGTAALIIILSVFNGFEELVKSMYGDFYASVKVVPAGAKTFQVSDAQVKQIRALPAVKAFSFVAEEKALLMGNYQTIVTVKGVEPHYNLVNNIGQYVTRGGFELGTKESPSMVLGAGIENAAGIDVTRAMGPLVLYVPNREASSFNSLDGLNSFPVSPAGSFVIQQDFDNKYVFTNLEFLKYMLNMQPDEFSSIELNTAATAEKTVQKALQQIMGAGCKVLTWYEQNQSLYAVMQAEKWVIYGILSLILVVAAFNMIGALSMLVLEKQKDIAVLMAMGADDLRIHRIFLLEGLLLASIGTGIGLVLAGTICWLQDRYHLIKLGGSTFIIDHYPVKSSVTDYLLVMATVALIAFGAAWITSRRAAAKTYSLRS
ncbi:MAG TPA: FtsX-like permease family protein [Sediminibacterium sp.]|nr:FtsX-like permease family protein [Sediminibacterium sp.]